MSQKSHKKTNLKLDLGNSRSRSWVFTLNNYTQLEINSLITQFTPAFLYVFQEELGKNKTPHLQGVVKWKNQRSFKTMTTLAPRAHWERCRNIKASVLYCIKDDTRNGNIWKKNIDKFQSMSPKKKNELFEEWRIRFRNRMIRNLCYQNVESVVIDKHVVDPS